MSLQIIDDKSRSSRKLTNSSTVTTLSSLVDAWIALSCTDSDDRRTFYFACAGGGGKLSFDTEKNKSSFVKTGGKEFCSRRRMIFKVGLPVRKLKKNRTS